MAFQGERLLALEGPKMTCTWLPSSVPGSVPDRKTFPLVLSEEWQSRTMWRGCVCTYVCMRVGCERERWAHRERKRQRQKEETGVTVVGQGCCCL